MRVTILLVIILASLIMSCSKKSSKPDTSIIPWDGKYRVEGSLVDKQESAITWPGTYEYDLVRLSETQLKVVSRDLKIEGHLILHGGSLSYYSKFGLLVNFNPSTNKITSISNFYGQPSSNGRSAVLDPSGINEWNPVTQKISIKFWMDETGVTGHRTSFDETWTYLGVR